MSPYTNLKRLSLKYYIKILFLNTGIHVSLSSCFNRIKRFLKARKYEFVQLYSQPIGVSISVLFRRGKIIPWGVKFLLSRLFLRLNESSSFSYVVEGIPEESLDCGVPPTVGSHSFINPLFLYFSLFLLAFKSRSRSGSHKFVANANGCLHTIRECCCELILTR